MGPVPEHLAHLALVLLVPWCDRDRDHPTTSPACVNGSRRPRTTCQPRRTSPPRNAPPAPSHHRALLSPRGAAAVGPAGTSSGAQPTGSTRRASPARCTSRCSADRGPVRPRWCCRRARDRSSAVSSSGFARALGDGTRVHVEPARVSSTAPAHLPLLLEPPVDSAARGVGVVRRRGTSGHMAKAATSATPAQASNRCSTATPGSGATTKPTTRVAASANARRRRHRVTRRSHRPAAHASPCTN